MKTNQTNKQSINILNNILRHSLPNKSYKSIGSFNMWATPSQLHKNAKCNLKRTPLRILARYKNGLYFTLSPKKTKVGEGNPNLIFEKRLRMAENEKLSYSVGGMRC